MKQDRRVQYTKKALRESLLSLLQEKPLEKIGVTELCERADINRSTFYVYYGSPQELLNTILDEMFDQIAALPQEFDTLYDFMLLLCRKLLNYRDLMLAISHTNDSLRLLFRLAEIWREHFTNNMSAGGLSGEGLEIAYRYVSAGSCFAIGAWILGDMRITPEEIARELEKLIQQGLNGFDS